VPVGVGRFVIRATHERGVGVPSSRSLATTSREANSDYRTGPTTGAEFGLRQRISHMRASAPWS